MRRPISSYVGQLHFLAIVHIGDRGLSLRHYVVVIDVVGQDTSLCGLCAG